MIWTELLKNLEVCLSWLPASLFLVYFLPIMKLFLLIIKLWQHQWLILLHFSGWFPIENWVVLPTLTFHTSQDNQPGPPRGLYYALLCFSVLSRFYFSSLAFVYYLYSSFFTWSFPLPTSPAWNIPALQLRGAASRCPAPASSFALAVPWVCCALSMAGGSSDVTFSDGLPYHTSSTARQSLQVAARHITLFDRSFTEFIITYDDL